MLELTEQQIQAVITAGNTPTVVVDPRTKTPYVLLRQDVYERMKDEEYDDSPWTDEERELLAWEAGKNAGWEDMDEYDHWATFKRFHFLQDTYLKELDLPKGLQEYL